VTTRELELAAGRAACEAQRVSSTGPNVTYVGSMLFAADELVLCLFESSSPAVVKDINERAGIPCERVMQSQWLACPLNGRDQR
jgi:hypothetical protein